MEYSIKEIEKDDLYDFIYVNLYSWNETYRGIMSDEYLDNMLKKLDHDVERETNMFDKIKREFPQYKRFILYVKDEPVGIIGISNSRIEEYPDAGELCCLYLLNKAKNNGYGRIMFEKAKEELKKLGFKDMINGCLKDNPTTEFYKHMGGKLVLSKEKNFGDRKIIENFYYYDKI